MLNGSNYPGAAGSQLALLLAGLGATPPATPGTATAVGVPVFAERLGQWLRWTGAISLSAALESAPGSPAQGPYGAGTRADAAAEWALAVEHVRETLAHAIAVGCREPASGPADFAPFRRHCLAQQDAMSDAITPLRQGLRAALARQSGALARLAAIDAVMDRALAAEERRLLARVPARLEAHFKVLMQRPGDAQAHLQNFRNDTARVLRAELAHRLLPARGLLAALQAP